METDEQRDGPRKPVVLKVRFRASTVDEFAERYSRDLSEGGMFVRSPGPLPRPGTLLLLECRLSDGALLINGSATVAWTRSQADESGPMGFGVRFDELSPESKAVLAMILETPVGTISVAEEPKPEPIQAPPAEPPAVLSVTPSVSAQGSVTSGATRFPTLIGEAPPLPDPEPPVPETPAPSRPEWFRSHDFDNEAAEPAAAPAPEPAPPAHKVVSTPAPEPEAPEAAPPVPKWFRSTNLLGTPAPEADKEKPATPEPPSDEAAVSGPKEAAVSAPSADQPTTPQPPPQEATTPELPRERRATPVPAAASDGVTPAAVSPPPEAAPPPERPRKTPPPPVHLPRPTPAVVAAPRGEAAAEPSAAGPARSSGRRLIGLAVLGAATIAAFGIGYAFLQFVLPEDQATKVMRELRRVQSETVDTPEAPAPAPAPTAAPAPTPDAAVAPPATAAPEPKAPEPVVVIPREPAPTPTKRAKPRAAASKPTTRKATRPTSTTKRRQKDDASSRFQKQLEELERMLKRK